MALKVDENDDDLFVLEDQYAVIRPLTDEDKAIADEWRASRRALRSAAQTRPPGLSARSATKRMQGKVRRLRKMDPLKVALAFSLAGNVFYLIAFLL